MNTDMTTTPAPASGPLILVPGAPSECKECGGTSLTWFASTRIRNDVVQGRLRTNDTECVFVLGCDECSETLHVAKADAIAELLATVPAQSHASHRSELIRSDLEAMLEACIPGGSIVDPQVVADNIRAWFGARPSVGAQRTELQGKLRCLQSLLWQLNAKEASAAVDEALATLDSEQGQTFQAGVTEWMGQCFPQSLYSNMTERGDRLLEEVLELLQAHGYDESRVATLVAYVFGRPVGEPTQEVGGVMVTLAAYCAVAGLDMQAAGDAELARINLTEVMAAIRAKQEAKKAIDFDTPLPGDAAAAAQLDARQ